MAEAFSIECLQGPGYVHVVPIGELDLSTVPALDQLLESEQRRPHAVVLLDLRKVTFLDSTGIHCLIRAEDRAREHGSELTIVRGGSQVQRALQVTGLDHILPLADEPPVPDGAR